MEVWKGYGGQDHTQSTGPPDRKLEEILKFLPFIRCQPRHPDCTFFKLYEKC